MRRNGENHESAACLIIPDETPVPKGLVPQANPSSGFKPTLRLFPGCHWDCPVSQEHAGALLGKDSHKRR